MKRNKLEITNTSASPTLGDALNIEASEKVGQAELVNSDQLPVDVRGREYLESAGVVFGEPTKDDPLFCDAQLPAGWRKQSTNHSMWSELVDDCGRVRASIFYKAAFYDRDAFMQATLLAKDPADILGK